MKLNEKYIGSMLIGHRFNQKYGDNEGCQEWSASEECTAVAFVVYQMMAYLNIGMEAALDYVMNNIKDNDYVIHNITDEDTYPYYHGFLAGEIIGMPTEGNIAKAEEAEMLWIEDKGCKYKYFREVLREVACT